MFLSGIKYQIEGESSTRAYKFQTIEAKFRNILFHLGTASDELLDAILYSITGQKFPRITASVIYISDGDGNPWILERSEKGLRVSFKRQVIDVDGEKAFRAALLESDDNLDGALIDIIEIKSGNGQFEGRRIKKSNQFHQYFNHAGEERLQRYLAKCQDFLECKSPIPLEQLISFANKSQSILQNYRYAKRMAESTQEEYGSLAKFDPSYITNLRQELDVLRKIEREAAFFNDPANNYEVLKAKQVKFKEELDRLCKKYEIHTLPMLDSEISWEVVVQALSRLQAYEKLEQAFRKSNHELEALVKPIFQDHVRTTKAFLLDDKKLLQNVEHALKSLTEIIKSVNDKTKTNTKNNFWKKIIDAGTPDIEGILDPQMLDDSRQAVDRILRSMSEMCANIEVTSASYTENVDEIQSRYEKIVTELGKAKNSWNAVASKFNLDPQASLKSILNLINNLGQISSLYVSRKECDDKVNAYKSNLKNTAKLIEEWRIVTKSQKSADLDRPSILISEVRNLLSYLDKKEAQLAKLNKVQNKIEFYHYLQADFRAKVKEYTHKWQQNFSLLGIDSMPFDGRNWRQLFNIINKCESLSQLIVDVDRPIRNEEIFSQKNISRPLSILTIKGPLNTGERIEFLRLLDFNSPHSNLLIFTNDRELATMMEKMEIGQSKEITIRKPASNKPQLEKNKTEGPLMSEKARAALELFKARNVNTST